MTFQKKHPLLDSLIDDLIRNAKQEARLQAGVDLHPELKLASHLRKAQVQTRRSRKALVTELKASLKNSGAPSA